MLRGTLKREDFARLLADEWNMGLLDAPLSDAPDVAMPAVDAAPAILHWKMRVQAEAAAEWLRIRKTGANPTRASIRPHLLKWCCAEKVFTPLHVNPSDGYLRTHVLSAAHWTPPD